MRENKKKLKFKKIKIASMSFLKGGGVTEVCSGLPGCYDVPASAPGNECSDGCLVTNGTGNTIIGDTSPVPTGVGIGICNYPAFELCKGY